MKKKIMTISLVVALAAIAIVGGTLAYFTDTDEATNTFTAGGVAIKLIEQQVNEDGTALEDFKQDQVLMPIVGSAQGDKDSFGQPVAENYIDKMVTIENTSKSDAWVRAYFAIPSALDDGFEEGFNASLNILHFNFGNEAGATTYNNQWLWGSEATDEHHGSGEFCQDRKREHPQKFLDLEIPVLHITLDEPLHLVLQRFSAGLAEMDADDIGGVVHLHGEAAVLLVVGPCGFDRVVVHLHTSIKMGDTPPDASLCVILNDDSDDK